MSNISAGYTDDVLGEAVYNNEDGILEDIREYVMTNMQFENIGIKDFDTDIYFEKIDAKVLFNAETEETYYHILGTELGDNIRDMISEGKVVSVYDFNMEYLDAYIEHAYILKDEENADLKKRYENCEITKEDYIEEIEILIYDKYIEDFMSDVIITIEHLSEVI